MRWRTAVAVALLILLPLGGGGMRHETVRRSDELRVALEALESSVVDGAPHTAQLEQARECWLRSRRYFSALTDHERIDRVNESLARIEAFLSHDETAEVLAELNGLLAMVERLRDTDRLFLRNLL